MNKRVKKSRLLPLILGAACALTMALWFVIHDRKPDSSVSSGSYSSEKSPVVESTALLEDGMPYLFQFESPIAEHPYGDGIMKETGCGPTSLAMAVSYLTGQTVSPESIADYSIENEFYLNGSGTSWYLFTDYPSLYGLKAWQTEADYEMLAENLQDGNVLIFSMGPGDFTRTGHIIVSKDLTENGMTNVHDPNSKERSKHWPLEDLISQATAVFVIRNPQNQ